MQNILYILCVSIKADKINKRCMYFVNFERKGRTYQTKHIKVIFLFVHNLMLDNKVEKRRLADLKQPLCLVGIPEN